jgi:tetratricopeptide (TPR) repeat protein
MERPDAVHALAAEGWVDFGNAEEAALELSKLSESNRMHPLALDSLYRVYALRGQWEACLTISNALLEVAPHLLKGFVFRVHALRRLNRIEEARDWLQDKALSRFPKSWLLFYKLASLECLLGNIPTSLAWMKQACACGNSKRIVDMALESPDFAAFKS